MSSTPAGPRAQDTTVDVLVVGSGTGMAAALSARDQDMSVLVVEKTEYVGGSTARSGGAFWIPGNDTLRSEGSPATPEMDRDYVAAVVGDTSSRTRWQAFLDHGPDAVAMLARTTPMEFFWARGYSDYHPEKPGGSALGRSCECHPFDASVLGDERGRLRPGVVEAPVPMPVTGADYKWMNLMTRTPLRSLPRIVKRVVQGLGGKLIGREYTAGGQALAAGMFAGLIGAGVPVWTRTSLVELLTDGGRVTGAVVEQDGTRVTVTARRGVVLAAGGFDHDMAMRHEYQSPRLGHWSLGSEGNEGDAIAAGRALGAGVDHMAEAWWFPAVAPVGDGEPSVLLAERSLPGSMIVDQTGSRFINEATDYMSFGQEILRREADGSPVTDMWLVFDQRYRNSYVLAGGVFPRMPLPKAWYDAGIAVRADNPGDLATAMGVPQADFAATVARFNEMAGTGIDHDFQRGASAYDRYYGDPTVTPNPNLRPLSGGLYAVRVVLSDLGTCGGLTVDERARVLREDGDVVPGLYAIGNTAANAFGDTYPGAGATIGQGLVFGHLAALDMAAAL
ncbi:3-ketosteroid-delta-1-dehydrogenase [Georgenia wutianyii]|uniref:3-ketosteroid-delta-1-dehydrogenase n=1 Tax=Georgenia wutianyii TaxID=2585135 RepID=A0ABX5VIZ2_9MICO|nr:3-ketosteroid-delta-1-dehydrogenase [Georgenia wutianyii]QDB78279.1 3-ketosteroid-delta-1-dehydrogenase [Georgenia wutianyii]